MSWFIFSSFEMENEAKAASAIKALSDIELNIESVPTEPIDMIDWIGTVLALECYLTIHVFEC